VGFSFDIVMDVAWICWIQRILGLL